MPRVGVIGAGISGLLCAQRLSELVTSAQLTIFEWGRGPGGRTARRRVTLSDGREISFDHATPFISSTTPKFDEILARWEAQGVAARWPEVRKSTFVGTPSNNAIARGLTSELEAQGARVLFGHHVRAATFLPESKQWRVNALSRATGELASWDFDVLILSDKLLVLPNQYAVLPEADWGPLALPSGLTSSGTVVLLIALEHAASDALNSFPAVHRSAAGAPATIIDLVVHDASKPQRSGPLDTWVVHSTAEYAATHLRGEALDDEAAVLEEMQTAFLRLLQEATQSCSGTPPPPVAWASVFAWDHAQPTAESRLRDSSHLLDTHRRAGVCGDFFGSAQGVEAAASSGMALAEALAPLLTEM